MKLNDQGLPLPGQECSICHKSISGLEVFGDVAYPLCWNHYAALNSEYRDTYYGLGPHEHKYDEDGNIILEATVFLDEEPESFTPDPDAPGLGVWETPKQPGWK